MPYEDNLDIITGHIALYQDAKFNKVDVNKARVVAKKFMSHLENHPDTELYEFLKKEYANPF